MADDRKTEMEAVLRKQRAAHHQMRPEPLALRKDRIQRAMKLLTDHADDLCKVMAADFGNRSPHQSMITDIAGTVNFGKYCLKHMDKWSRPEKRHVQFRSACSARKPRCATSPRAWWASSALGTSPSISASAR